jgi:hypothetical protein
MAASAATETRGLSAAIIAACGAATFLMIAGLVGHGDLLGREMFWLPFAIASVGAAIGGWIGGLFGRGHHAPFSAAGQRSTFRVMGGSRG